MNENQDLRNEMEVIVEETSDKTNSELLLGVVAGAAIFGVSSILAKKVVVPAFDKLTTKLADKMKARKQNETEVEEESVEAE